MPPAFLFAWEDCCLETVGQRRRHVPDHLRIKVRAKLQLKAERVDDGGICVCSLKHGRHDPRVVLRLGQDAGDALVLNAPLDLGNAGRAWVGGVAERYCTGCGEVKRNFEVLVSVVEHHEAATADWIEDRVHLGRQRLHLRARLGGVGEIGAGVVRVSRGQLGGNDVQPRAGNFGRQPGVRIMLPVGVIVMPMVVVFVLVGVVIVPVVVMFVFMGVIVMPVVVMFVFMGVVIVPVVVMFVFMGVVIVPVVVMFVFMGVIVMPMVVVFVFVGVIVMPVVVMSVVMGVVIMPVVVMFVVMFVIIMVIVPVIIVIAVGMRFEQGPFAERQQLNPVRLKQRGHRRVSRQGLDRVFHPGRQVFANPEDQVRVLQGCGFGGAQVVFVRGGTGRNDKFGRAKPFHHAGDQSMHRRNISGDIRDVGDGRSAQQGRGKRDRKKRSRHWNPHVIL